MNPEPNDQEFKNVLSLPPDKRYEHFLKRVVNLDCVWMVEEDEQRYLSFNHKGLEVLPVWPARRYAEHAMIENFPNACYVSVNIRDWLARTLSPLRNVDDVAIAVFPDSAGEGIQVSVADMIADIETELNTRLGSLPGYDPNAAEIDVMELLKPKIKASLKAKPKGKLP